MWKLHTFNVVKLAICVNFCGGKAVFYGQKCKLLPGKSSLVTQMTGVKAENLRKSCFLQEITSFRARKYEFFLR